MDLHGVPPAQEDGRAFLAFQIDKLATAAGRTIGIAVGSRALKQVAGPHIDGGQPWRYMAGMSAEDFQRIRHVQGRNYGDGRPKHSCRLASWLHAGRRFGNHAAQAAGAFRKHGHCQAVAA